MQRQLSTLPILILLLIGIKGGASAAGRSQGNALTRSGASLASRTSVAQEKMQRSKIAPPKAEPRRDLLAQSPEAVVSAEDNKPIPWAKIAVAASTDHPGEIVYTITYGNRSATRATKVIIRDALPPELEYVKDSASHGGTYDAENRELVWKVDELPKDSGQTQPSVSFRAKPLVAGGGSTKIMNVATIECAELEALFASNTVMWQTLTSVLTAVFALPETFLAKKTIMMPLLDVRGEEYQSAVDRLEGLGVITGYPDRTFLPDTYVNRAESVKMVVLAADLKDHRDVTRITYVLTRPAKVTVSIRDASGTTVKVLAKNVAKPAGDHGIPWDGRADTGDYVKAGTYTYVVKAVDANRVESTFDGGLTVLSPTPRSITGVPSFRDVKSTDWFAGYVAEAEDRMYVKGYPDKTFRPKRNVSRAEATAIVVRALGLEKEAQKRTGKDVGFADAEKIPPWATGYVAVASTTAPKAGDQLIVGYPGNTFLAHNNIRRTEAAAIVSRFVDRNVKRTQFVSGTLAPGATLTINGKAVSADANGRFRIAVDILPNEVTTIAVLTQ